jgi:CheY-like chemotaxis protein
MAHTPTPHGGSRASLLVIEDHAVSRDALAEMLRAAGYEVDTAADGSEGLGLLTQGFRPAAILLDLMMPGIDGWDFRARQKRDPELAAIPVIAISAAGRLVDTDHSLVKPIEVEQLLALLRRIVTAPCSSS